MGTKRIGRVGERDAGFHSNGALPSALSCCHYGSEVFRSCRKQSYGKPARLRSSSVLCFVFFCFFIRLSVCPCLYLLTVLMRYLSHRYDPACGFCFPQALFPFCISLLFPFKICFLRKSALFDLYSISLYCICVLPVFIFLCTWLNHRPIQLGSVLSSFYGL